MKLLKILVLSAAAAAVPVLADTSDEVRAMLEHARAAHDQALALEHGWAVTEPLIEEARAALAAGDLEAAQEHAERALLTAEKALTQARSERDAWADRVVQR